jgi:hypothetical protein
MLLRRPHQLREPFLPVDQMLAVADRWGELSQRWADGRCSCRSWWWAKAGPVECRLDAVQGREIS